jgi:acyl-CoA thioesterase-1
MHKRCQSNVFFAPVTIALICLTLLFSGCGEEQESGNGRSRPTASQKEIMGTIVAVGDSLTAGYGVDESEAYPALLEAKLHADGYPFKVINAGVSGETSSGTLSRINWVISSLKPNIVILETGANDGLRGIDPDVLAENLERIVRILKENDVQIILAGMKILPNLGPDYTKAFAAVYPRIAASQDVILIPFFLGAVAGEPSLNQSDRIHPTAEGYRRIVDNIYPYVVEGVNAYLNR